MINRMDTKKGEGKHLWKSMFPLTLTLSQRERESIVLSY